MNRHDTIASINEQLEQADDETVEAVADYVRSVTAAAPALRPLSERERRLLAQSREDFKNGEVLTLEDSIARTDALFAKYRAAKPTEP